jgi:hypothetical protein
MKQTVDYWFLAQHQRNNFERVLAAMSASPKLAECAGSVWSPAAIATFPIGLKRCAGEFSPTSAIRFVFLRFFTA